METRGGGKNVSLAPPQPHNPRIGIENDATRVVARTVGSYKIGRRRYYVAFNFLFGGYAE